MTIATGRPIDLEPSWLARLGGEFELPYMQQLRAFLLQESLRSVLAVAPGFDSSALTVRLSLPRKGYGDNARLSSFYRAVEARVRELPGVSAVAAVNHVPLNGALASADYRVEDRPAPADDHLPTAQYRMVTPGYFDAMGVKILAGRTFDETDLPDRPAVGIISQSLARQSFPDRDPIGHRLLVKDTPDGFRPIEIVGVAGDVHHGSLETAPEAHLYVAYHQVRPALLAIVSGGDEDLKRWRLRLYATPQQVVFDEVFDTPLRLLTARHADGAATLFVMTGDRLTVLRPR